MIEDEALRVNLSYVLHEPSTSPQVGAYLARARQARPDLDRAVARLAALSGPDLVARTLLLAPDGVPQPDAGESVRTVKLRASELLGRVLAARFGGGEAAWHVTPLDDPACADAVDATFFRGPARLCLPGPSGGPDGWFAALTIRPGGETLLLEITRVAGPDARDRTLRAAEAAIRMHMGQWACAAALWPRPAEAQLSEFLTT